MTTMSWAGAFRELVPRLNQRIAEQLKILIESKHLYQKVRIDPQQIVEELQEKLTQIERGTLKQQADRLLATALLIPATEELYAAEKTGGQSPIPTLRVDNVKLFCSSCDRREAYVPVHFMDAANELRRARMHGTNMPPLPSSFQLFLLVYQCQSCRGMPEGILVRRQDWDLFLEGRSPIEQVEVPTFIPKLERGLFRDAIVAMNTGKILAALFYLRAFIEQFGRRCTKTVGRSTGDEILTAYSATLPDEHRGHMPSLRDWYDRLSDAIHGVREDVELFEKAKADIERHFDIRRIFKIPECTQ
jgi:hypothetical protein